MHWNHNKTRHPTKFNKNKHKKAFTKYFFSNMIKDDLTRNIKIVDLHIIQQNFA